MTKKFAKITIAIIILLAIYFIFFKVINVQDIILKNIYPIRYSEYVEEYSNKNGLDPYMVYAIIKVESNFNPNVKSRK